MNWPRLVRWIGSVGSVWVHWPRWLRWIGSVGCVDELAQVGKVDRKCRKCVDALAQVGKVDRKCRVCGCTGPGG